VASRFDAGATIVFGQLHRRVPALARLCVAIGQIFGCRVQTNTYFTPPHAQGFRPHWDTHEVFVLQVAGTKSWSVYDTKVTLPLKGQRFDPEQHEPGPVSGQFELGPGDVAFLSARVASAR
jgi:ribosomal protein L16 Arg81 hydroxylase